MPSLFCTRRLSSSGGSLVSQGYMAGNPQHPLWAPHHTSWGKGGWTEDGSTGVTTDMEVRLWGGGERKSIMTPPECMK